MLKKPSLIKISIFCCIALGAAAIVALAYMLLGVHANAPAVQESQPTSIRFIHPLYGYTLNLPTTWNGRYDVREEKDSTVFFCIPSSEDSKAESVLMRIGHAPSGSALIGRKLGEYFGVTFFLASENAIPVQKETCPQMRSDVQAIVNSFARTIDPENFYIKKFLTENLPLQRTNNSIVFITYKYLAPDTEENDITSKYFWIMTQEYTWDGTAMHSGMGTSGPVVVRFRKVSHYDYRVIDARTPRDGSYYMQDARKLLSEPALRHPVFRNDVQARNAFIKTLEERIGEWERGYFGPSFNLNAGALY